MLRSVASTSSSIIRKPHTTALPSASSARLLSVSTPASSWSSSPRPLVSRPLRQRQQQRYYAAVTPLEQHSDKSEDLPPYVTSSSARSKAAAASKADGGKKGRTAGSSSNTIRPNGTAAKSSAATTSSNTTRQASPSTPHETTESPKPASTPSPATSPSSEKSSPSPSSASSSTPRSASGAPEPPPPNTDKSIKGRIKALYTQVKFLFRFYLNAVKQIWRDRTRVREIREACQKEGREMTWSESRLAMVHKSDLKKLPLFLAILIIVEEVLPLIVIYAPFLLPSTCILPSQLNKIRQTEEIKRSKAIDKLRQASDVKELLKMADLPLKGAESLDKVPSFTGQQASDFTEKWNALSKESLTNLSQIYALSTKLRPAAILRSNLEQRLHFIRSDDYLLQDPASVAFSKGAVSYDALPQDQPTLAEVLSERGLQASEIDSKELFTSLRRWVQLTRAFAAPVSDIKAQVMDKAPLPLHLLFAPVSLYPPPSMFTPSLQEMKAREQVEEEKGLLQKSKEVVQEVVEAQGQKTKRDEEIRRREEEQASKEERESKAAKGGPPPSS